VNFQEAAELAAQRAVSDLSATPSLLARQTLGWMGNRFDVRRAAEYFTQVQSLPVLALPWWLEESFREPVDSGFQLDLMYSTINFYYFTRILDDAMDGHAIEPAVLPAMHFFHSRFVRPYFRYFGLESEFWGHFERLPAMTVEAAAAESTLREVSAEEFLTISARKAAGGALPLAAVCVRYDGMDLLGPWESMFGMFCRWHQMRDDFLDWDDDAKAGSASWLLTEAKRRAQTGESLAAWMGREGFAWVRSVMKAWMEETLAAAAGLRSEKLMAYLKLRDEEFTQQIDGMIRVAEAFRGLLRLGTAERSSEEGGWFG
jgi:hypothetical protein